MKKLPFLLAIVLSTAFVQAQVTIAPTNLFIEEGNQFGTYMVINGSNQNQEIGIDFFFAYGQLDENGQRANIHDNEEMAERYSIAENIRAFPQSFVLTPGQRQLVRLNVRPPRDLQDGTYWSRIRTSATPESPPVETANNEAVTARVGISIEQVTGLFYKKGTVTTGIEIDGIRTEEQENNELAVLTDFRRTGNSPFLGSISTTLLNSNNQIIREAFVSTSLYFDGTHRQALNLNDVPAGNYTIQVKFEARRSDISSNDIIPMETVTESIPYTIR